MLKEVKSGNNSWNAIIAGSASLGFGV